MKKDAIRMIAFDMDGTVLYNGAEITLRLQDILRRALEEGIHVVPCTGRGRKQMPATLEALDLSYSITSNGSRIVDERTGESIYTNLVDWETAVQISRDVTAIQSFICVHMNEHVYFQGVDEEFVRAKYSMPAYMPVDLMECAEDLIRQSGGGVEKIYVQTSGETRQKIRDRILGKYDVYGSSSSLENLEFGKTDCSKGAALTWLCGKLGIGLDQVVAFGDGENDKEMLSLVGLGVAMGNAHPACKEAADVVIGTCAEDGVAEFLENLLAE